MVQNYILVNSTTFNEQVGYDASLVHGGRSPALALLLGSQIEMGHGISESIRQRFFPSLHLGVPSSCPLKPAGRPDQDATLNLDILFSLPQPLC